MKKYGKRLKKICENVDFESTFIIPDAIKIVKDSATTKFDETVEIALNLGVDPKHADQMVRGTVTLPHGTGKSLRVAVFAKGDKAKEANDAGADIVGDDDLAERISDGKIDFDLLIATPDMMPTIGKIGKILGPKGLMPNPKLGTVTQDVKSAISSAKSAPSTVTFFILVFLASEKVNPSPM